MRKEFTCIICPNGCSIEAEGRDGEIVSIKGALCQKGEDYVRQELTCPKRNIATSVRVLGGTLPLASVRLTNPIPKERIFDAMDEIKKVELAAPVKAGTVVIAGILGYESDVVATKDVDRQKEIGRKLKDGGLGQ